MDGTSGTTDIKLDFCDDIVALLDGVFMASFEAEYDAVSLFVQYEYTNIAPDAKINRKFDYKVPPIGPTISIDVSTKVDVEDIQYR